MVTADPEAQNVTSGEGIIQLSCTASGFPPPTIVWFHNSTIEDFESFFTEENLNFYTTRSNFTMSVSSLNDSGSYFCRAIIEGFDDVDSKSVIVLVQGQCISVEHEYIHN